MKTVAVVPEAQVKVELTIPQVPLDDVKVKPEPKTFGLAEFQKKIKK